MRRLPTRLALGLAFLACVEGMPAFAETETAETIQFPSTETESSGSQLLIEADGVLIAWAVSEDFPASLEVRVASGEVRARALSAAPGEPAWLQHAVESSGEVEVLVTAPADAEGVAQLHTLVIYRSSEADHAAGQLEAIGASALEAGRAGDPDGVARAAQEALAIALPGDAAIHPDVVAGLLVLLEAIQEVRRASGVEGVLADERLELKERVLGAFERTYPARHPRLRRMLFVVAEESRQLGRYPRSAALYRRVVAQHEADVVVDIARLQAFRYYLGALLLELDEPADAVEVLERILRDTHLTEQDDGFLSDVRFNLTTGRLELGDGHGALGLALEVLAHHEVAYADDPVEISRAQYNAARAFTLTGGTDEARELFEEVVGVRSEHLEPHHPWLLDAKDALAAVRSGRGDYAEALRIREEIHEAYVQTLPEGHPNRVRAYRNLLVDRSIAGGHPDVESELLEILGSCRSRGDDYETVLTWTHLGWHRMREEDREGIVPVALGVSQALSHASRLLSTTLAPREAEAGIHRYEANLASALSFGAGLGPEVDRALFAMVEGLRSVGLRSARLMRAALREEGAASSRETCVRLSEELVAATRAGSDLETLRRLRRELEEEQRRLVAGGGLAALGPDPTPEALAALLGDGEVLVSYRRYQKTHLREESRLLSWQDGYLAFVLTRDSLRLVTLGSADAIEEAALDWLSAIGRADDEVASRRARELGSLVLGPLTELGGAQRVIVVLDGELSSVPFDALPFGQALLGDQVDVDFLSSCWELLASDPEPAGREVLVAMGNVDYRTPSDLPSQSSGTPTRLVRARTAAGFLNLPGTGAEVEAVEGLFSEHVGGKSRVHTGSAAGREALRKASDATYLHLATHGYFSMQSPSEHGDVRRLQGLHPMMLCGLALAGANVPDAGGAVEGIVTAQELATFDLDGCRLVVLSACDTHLGVPLAGQGLASLQKAARMAGAQSVVTSLWRVDDAAASELMVAFYGYLWGEALEPRAALWAAKNELREAGRPLRDWAGWVLTGRPDR